MSPFFDKYIKFNNYSKMFGQYKTCKDRQKYISHHYKDDKVKSAIWDYVSGYTSSVNDYLRANHKWDAVTKYLDMAFNSEEYSSYDIIDAYRTVEEDYLNNLYGITKDNIDEHIGDILINNGYMSASSTLISPWGDTWNDTEVILHIMSSTPIKYLDIDKIFEGEELPSGEQLELLLNRKTKLQIVGSYLKFEDDPEIPKGNRGRFDIDGTLIIECEIINDKLNEQLNMDKFTPTTELMHTWFDEFNEKYFNNVLPLLTFKVGNCGKVTWGCFSFRRTYSIEKRNWISKFDPSKCSITLSDSFIGTEYNLKNTMLHEMVHYYIHYKYNYNPTRHHGREFKYEASKINKDGIWNITPTNDYIENEVSELGIERHKNRILDEYIIGIYESYNKYGVCHAFRTDDKHIEAIERGLIEANIKHVWYKIKINDPMFGIHTTIVRTSNSFTYIESGYTVDDIFNKIDNKYGLIDKNEFYVELDNDNTIPIYITILNRNKEYWVAKTDTLKNVQVLKSKYGKASIFNVYTITGYNESFINQDISKSKFRSIAYTKGAKNIYDILKEKYDIDINNAKKVNI